MKDFYEKEPFDEEQSDFVVVGRLVISLISAYFFFSSFFVESLALLILREGCKLI